MTDLNTPSSSETNCEHSNARPSRCSCIVNNRKRVRSDYMKALTYKKDVRRLHIAACCNDIERTMSLLKEGVNPNVGDLQDRRPLHIACAKGYSDIVRVLLQYKADCNVVDKLGNTPLHLAVCTDSTETVNLLLEQGASVSSVGISGCTPLKLAQAKLRILQRHTSQDYNTLRSQVAEVIEMMTKLVEKQSQEAELVSAFSTRLNLSRNSSQVADDVKQLLDSLDNLHINKPFLKPSKLDHVTNSSSILKDSLSQLQSLSHSHLPNNS